MSEIPDALRAALSDNVLRKAEWEYQCNYSDPSGPTAALRNALEAMRQVLLAALAPYWPPWQPTETAPKDQPVLLSNPESQPTVGVWSHAYGGYWDAQGDHWGELTHWMPLPPRPTKETP